ncbi:catalase family peroxidase [Planococcus koreensis]|uniref:catalase family peroxidase n=1 Tax=Planococcus koreensis TaxID=112331 RepID=UPI0039FCA94E
MEKKQLAGMAIDRIEKVFGKHNGYRRAHARGVMYEAVFTATGGAADYTTAEHLQAGETRAAVRFSHSSPNPIWTDAMSPVKGMAVQFQLPSGEITNIVGVNAPVFFAKTPETFTEMLGLAKSLKKGRLPLPTFIKLLIKYPDSRAAIKVLRKMHAPASFVKGRYYAMHVFYFIDGEGLRTPIKYEWEPDAGVAVLSPKDAKAMGRGHFEQELESRLRNGPAGFRLNIIIGEPGDPTDDPTKEWPKERRKIVAGHLEIRRNRLDDEKILFDPTVMVPGIACSEDRILAFRSLAYSISHARRTPGT